MVKHIEEMPFAESFHKIIFRDSESAYNWCKGKGVEIGASAHNPFHLVDCVNVAASDDAVFRTAEIAMCGSYAFVDHVADAAALPFQDKSLDYVINSHMIEHHPNPISCLLEWARVLQDGGIIFVIYPHRNALPSDVPRPISSFDEIFKAYRDNIYPVDLEGANAHYYVYDTALMRAVVERAGELLSDTHFEVVEEMSPDDKVGNGHIIVARVNHVAKPVSKKKDRPRKPDLESARV